MNYDRSLIWTYGLRGVYLPVTGDCSMLVQRFILWFPPSGACP